MTRNLTPRPIKAAGARDSHGRILESGAGALYVHMHREAGLAHRHYVLKPWQVRLLAIFTSRPAVLMYALVMVSWGYLAGQAARVPLLKQEIAAHQADAQRLDTLTARLSEVQEQYDQVQRLLGAGATPSTRERSSASTSANMIASPTSKDTSSKVRVSGTP